MLVWCIQLKEQFVWFSIAIQEAEMTDSIYITGKKSLRIAEKINSVSFLDSTRITTARLNHSIKLLWFGAVAIIVSR